MRLTSLVRLGAAVTALGFLAPIAASASIRVNGPIHPSKSVGLKASGGNAIVSCPAGSTQYILCVAPTKTSPNTVYWWCGSYVYTVSLSGDPYASKVANGKKTKNLPVTLSPYSNSQVFWVNTYSVKKKNPKLKKGKVAYYEALTYTCYYNGSSVGSGTVLVGIV